MIATNYVRNTRNLNHLGNVESYQEFIDRDDDTISSPPLLTSNSKHGLCWDYKCEFCEDGNGNSFNRRSSEDENYWYKNCMRWVNEKAPGHKCLSESWYLNHICITEKLQDLYTQIDKINNNLKLAETQTKKDLDSLKKENHEKLNNIKEKISQIQSDTNLYQSIKAQAKKELYSEIKAELHKELLGEMKESMQRLKSKMIIELRKESKGGKDEL